MGPISDVVRLAALRVASVSVSGSGSGSPVSGSDFGFGFGLGLGLGLGFGLSLGFFGRFDVGDSSIRLVIRPDPFPDGSRETGDGSSGRDGGLAGWVVVYVVVAPGLVVSDRGKGQMTDESALASYTIAYS